MTIIFIEKEVFILIINLNILSKPKKIKRNIHKYILISLEDYLLNYKL